MDSTLAWPTLRLKYLLDAWFPWLANTLVSRVMATKMIKDATRQILEIDADAREDTVRQKIAHDWGLKSFPGMAFENPVVQENWFPAVYSGRIEILGGLKGFESERTVLFEDGKTIMADAVVFCTGYTFDLSILPELELDGACGKPLRSVSSLTGDSSDSSREDESNEQTPLPRLYQMLFPPRFASSLAVLSWMKPQEPVWCVSELASMAIAQIWSEHSRSCAIASARPSAPPSMLPSMGDMNAAVDDYQTWWRNARAAQPAMQKGFVQAHSWYRFLHAMAGTGMYGLLDHMFTATGWRLRYRDPLLHKWLTYGPMNTHAWRLIPTNPLGIPGKGRAAWPGARTAIQVAVGRFECLDLLPSLTDTTSSMRSLSGTRRSKSQKVQSSRNPRKSSCPCAQFSTETVLTCECEEKSAQVARRTCRSPRGEADGIGQEKQKALGRGGVSRQCTVIMRRVVRR